MLELPESRARRFALIALAVAFVGAGANHFFHDRMNELNKHLADDLTKALAQDETAGAGR